MQGFFLSTAINSNSMLCYCPFCADTLPEKLIDGVIFCPKCSRMVETSWENHLLSAFRQARKNKFSNYKQLKFDLQMNEKDFEFVIRAYEDQLSIDEFQKVIRKLGFSKTS